MTNKKPASAQPNNPFPKMEEEVLNFWDKAGTFKKSLNRPSVPGDFCDPDERDYRFYDGPPFATGEPHYGHIVASIMKDAVPRFFTMRGYRVERRWGWDCHGLPVENLAEKELKLKNKQDIEEMGVAKFNDYCKSIVLRYAEEWKKTVKRIGRWVDMENDYKTMDPDYMETIWWVFKSLWDKNLVYQGYKAMHICPRCGTTLSNFEVTQNYKDIKDLSATVKFKLQPGQKYGEGKETKNTAFILAWTTTPWTLIGNVALAVGGNINYTALRVKGAPELLIVASDRVEEIFKSKEIEIVHNDIKGRDLVGLEYDPLLDYFKDAKLENKDNGWQIYAADFVTTEEGTGIVHIAPAFGEDDMRLGQEKKLPFIQHVDGFGRFTSDVKDWPGEEVKPMGDPKKTDKKIVEELKKQKKIFVWSEYDHSYPHCWRCETPLLNYATNSWFVKVTDLKDDLVQYNQRILWAPDHVRDGRFGKWLEQARDWAVSRSRYWGSTLPVWVCDKCGEKKVIGSRAELEKLSGEKIADLHKQYVDKITFGCDKCLGTMTRIPEVFDCWFESGSMPYGQEHYPFSGKKYKGGAPVPADFIAEGIDQTRGWFYTMAVLAAALFDTEAAKNIIANGIVLAEDGQKMAKRLKNYPDPAYVFDTYGVDAMRYYLFASPVMTADNLNFSEEGVREALRKVVMILWNVYKFYSMYEAQAVSVAAACNLPDCENILDKWILARLNLLIKETTEAMNNYNLPRAVRPLEDFINDFSTWYLRRSRERFKSETADKKSALDTTKYVLIQLAKVMAPFMPFMAEQLWQKTTKFDFKDENKSVHLESWPLADDPMEAEDLNVIKEMEAVRKIVELGLKARDEAGIKVRQPLAELRIANYELRMEYAELVRDELNVKKVISKKGEGILAVELDLAMSDELKLEGLKREIVRQVNAMRKNAGLTIKDKIILSWSSDSDLVKKVFSQLGEEIKKETLSDQIVKDEGGKEVIVNEEKIKLRIEKK